MTSDDEMGDDVPLAGARSGGVRTGQRCHDFDRRREIGAAMNDGDFATDYSACCDFAIETAVKGGGGGGVGGGGVVSSMIYDGRFMCGGERNWIKWFKLRGAGVKLTQRYLTASGEEVWARRVRGTEET